MFAYEAMGSAADRGDVEPRKEGLGVRRAKDRAGDGGRGQGRMNEMGPVVTRQQDAPVLYSAHLCLFLFMPCSACSAYLPP
jgi:hypothetical protein